VASGTIDYYAVLGLERTCTDTEIKKAFRLKARECHPDVCKDHDAEERFKEINEAYDVLSDSQKRDTYDRYGTVNPQAGYGGAGGPDLGDIFAGFGMDDLFSSFFGGGGGGRRVRTEGRDMAAQVVITLEDAANGIEKEIMLSHLAACDECGATGSVGDAGTTTCSDCQGRGQRRTERRTFLGVMETLTPCDTCAGTGSVVENPCQECQGSGRVPEREKVTIPVPAGIKDGQQLNMSGMGEAGLRGATGGDLLVTVRVSPHEFLHREGDDLHCRMILNVVEASLGGTMSVPGLFDDVDVEFPAGVQYGATVRVRGRGMTRLRGSGSGDLIAHIGIEVPRKLSKEQRKLFEELRESIGSSKTPLQKLKEWLTS
jgi:molecular chaperone DnaJ